MDMTKAAFLANVITDTIEGGGISYWAEHRGYRWEDTTLGGKRNWAEVKVRDAEAEDKTWTTITQEKVDEAFKKLTLGRVPYMNEHDRGQLLAAYFTDGEAGDMDALMGDLIFQVILFGQVKYG